MTNKMSRRILVVLLMLAIPVSILANTGVITKVLDSDLIQIGDSFVARFTGLTVLPKSDPLGYKIYDFTKRELEGKTVKIFTWTTDDTAKGIVYNENERPFVQIYYGKDLSVSFNEVLLKKGYARIDKKYLPEDLKERYLELEKEAREAGLGIWEEKE